MIKDISKFPPFKPKTEQWGHQSTEFIRSRDQVGYGYWWEMGCGKSKAAIDNAAYLFHKQEIDGLVIFSEKGCYMGWVDSEIPLHMPTSVPIRMAYWSSSANAREKAAINNILVAQDDCLDILVVNIEALSSDRCYAAVKAFTQNHYTMGVVDESSAMKNWKAQRTQSLFQLRDLFEYRRVMSGTPMLQGVLDLWSQIEWVVPGGSGYKKFFDFRSHYANIVMMQAGRRQYPQILGYRNVEELTAKIKPFTSRILKEECMDLPEKIFETHYVDWSPEQEHAYTTFKEQAVLQIEQGLATSTNPLTLLNKLHQINCGYVKLDDGTIVRFPQNRTKELLKIIEKVPDEKVVIWCHHQEDIQEVYKTLSAEYGQESAVHYYGETTDLQRDEARRRFKSDKKCRFFVASRVGAKGINELVVSCLAIYYSYSYNLGDWLQSQDRQHRPGQTRAVTYITLVIRRSVDEKIAKALRAKIDLSTMTLNQLRAFLIEDDVTWG